MQQTADLVLEGQVGGETSSLVARGNVGFYRQGPRVVAVDLADPSRPRELGRSAVLPSRAVYGAFAVADGFAVLSSGYANDSNVLTFVDIADAARPRLLSSLGIDGYVRDITVEGRYAYVASDEVGLRIVDVADPRNPRSVGVLDTPGLARAVAVSGSFAYVAGWTEGLGVVDISNPVAPVTVVSLNIPGYATGVQVRGTVAYVLAANSERYGPSSLHVIDVGNPRDPEL